MNRREFLIGSAGILAGTVLGLDIFRVNGALAANVEDAVGPLMAEGLECLPTEDGFEVYLNGVPAFRVNSTGRTLLHLADGHHSIEAIVSDAGCTSEAEAVADFFISLAKAGYLQNRIEVNLVEARM